VKDYKRKILKYKQENEALAIKNSKLRDEIVEKEKNMLITCMDLDDTKGEKALLEREVRIIKSVSNLDGNFDF
jgi:hypothetical protein